MVKLLFYSLISEIVSFLACLSLNSSIVILIVKSKDFGLQFFYALFATIFQNYEWINF